MSSGIEKRNWGFDLADIVAADHESNGHPRVSEQDRGAVVSALEDALLDEDAKWSLLRDVKRLCGGCFRHTEIADDQWIQRVLVGGVKVLDEEELALLLLNPVMVCRLYDELLDCVADYDVWWAPMDRLGRQLMAERGIDFSLPAGEIGDEARMTGPGAIAAGMLGKDSLDQVPPSPGNQIEVPANECDWIVGNANCVRQPAIIEIERLSDGGIGVGLGGFLDPGPDVAVQVIWQSSSGAVIAESAPSSPFRLQAFLRHDDHNPVGGDRIQVHYRSGPESSPKMELRIEVVIE